jgi:hypothetical protein
MSAVEFSTIVGCMLGIVVATGVVVGVEVVVDDDVGARVSVAN